VRNLSALVIGVFCSRTQPPRLSTLFPYTSLFRSGPGRGYQLTLIEAETLEELHLPWERARRNVVTRGASLNPLVGRRFRIGGIECIGRRLAEPCAHLEQLSGPGLLRPLVHRGGLRA